MRRASLLLPWLPVLALTVVGSTIDVRPSYAAEPSEELKAIRELLAKIDQRLENQNTISLQMLDRLKADFTQLKNDFATLRDEIAKVQRDLNDLRLRPTTPSTSYYGGSTSASPAATASIKLVNTYLSDMTATINGIYYVVPPGQSRVVPVIPGIVTYQVYQTQDIARTTTMKPGEVLTLSLYPQP
jgi:hypothetical protein